MFLDSKNLEDYLQGVEGGIHDEMIIFPGATDSEAIEDQKRPKLCKGADWGDHWHSLKLGG
jgi:hypothetical protein